MTEMPTYTKKDFASDQELRWCPGCGDYSIINSVQQAMTKIGKKREDICFISGIGCSSRFPYYMGTYGLHTIHGRAPGFATGIKCQNPDLSVWEITGDGDALAIGGNHFIHALRRNVNMNIILFNNEIYGLTKGQYSPTSVEGTVTKSSPYGSLDHPFRPAELALGAGTTFYARTMDTDPKHMQEMFLAAEKHQGVALVEVMQNCVIFNDKVHDEYTNRKTRDEHVIWLENGKPLLCGKEKNKGLKLIDSSLQVVELGKDGITEADIEVFNSSNRSQAFMLANLYHPAPMPMGVFYENDSKESYEVQLMNQIKGVQEKKGKSTVKDLLYKGDTWTI